MMEKIQNVAQAEGDKKKIHECNFMSLCCDECKIIRLDEWCTSCWVQCWVVLHLQPKASWQVKRHSRGGTRVYWLLHFLTAIFPVKQWTSESYQQSDSFWNLHLFCVLLCTSAAWSESSASWERRTGNGRAGRQKNRTLTLFRGKL